MPSVRNLGPCEAAWAAGIIDGEGCIFWAKGRSSDGPRITVKMTDFDVIERLHLWSGMGTVVAHKSYEGRKQAWIWVVCRHDDFLALAEAIEPWLLSRRAAKLREVRALLLQRRADIAARRALCHNGHERAVTGTNERGYCLECGRQATARYRDRKAGADASSP